MIAFEMNAENFLTYLGGGTCDGTRVGPEGVELALAEHPSDADTLALYHLHNGVLTDAGPLGCHLSAVGDVTLGPDGATFDRASGQYLQDTDAFTLRGRDAFTIECWFRLAEATAPGDAQGMAAQYYNATVYLFNDEGAVSLRCYVVEEWPEAPGYQAFSVAYDWTAAEDTDWHHVAMTWQKGVALRLWLDGAEVGTPVTNLSGNDIFNTDTRLYVGRRAESNGCFDGMLDEVRVSQVVRYTAAFQPRRRMAEGCFTSPTFDGLRTAALWRPPELTAEIPTGAGIELHTRTGDTLDGGEVDAPWREADLADDRGRYQQWRATLTPPAEGLGLESPEVASVSAFASEAGANLYHGTGDEAVSIDYASPVARLGPEVDAVDAADLAPDAVHWFGLRSTDADGRASPTVDAEVRIELDADGQLVPPRPAPVESLSVTAAGQGRVQLTWLALAEMGEAAPDVFRIYSNGGAGEVNFDTPLGEVAATVDGRLYQWTSDAQPGGSTVVFAVRAETASGGADASPAQVEVAVDATAPAAPGHVAAAPALGE